MKPRRKLWSMSRQSSSSRNSMKSNMLLRKTISVGFASASMRLQKAKRGKKKKIQKRNNKRSRKRKKKIG
jgi:hypothetical protein